MRIIKRSVLPASADAVWKRLQETETLRFIAAGFVQYNTQLPETWPVSEPINLRPVPFFAKRPTDHFVTFEEIDHEQMVAKTHEYSAEIRSWDHTMSVEDLGNNTCLYQDIIELSAGIRTIPTWLFAQFFYEHRHNRWPLLLIEV